MMLRHAAIVVLVASAVPLSPAAAPQFRSRVEAVRVDVLVTDRGQPVRGLTRADFEIRDNGVLQQVDHVSFEEMPLNVVLVLDTSGSLRDDRLRVLGRSAGVLLDALNGECEGSSGVHTRAASPVDDHASAGDPKIRGSEGPSSGSATRETADLPIFRSPREAAEPSARQSVVDQAALVTFSNMVTMRAPLTSCMADVRHALADLTGGGYTALVDGVYAGMLLAQSDADRAIVVVLSDGVDTISWLTPDAVVDAAKRSDVVVYSVFTGGPRAPALLRELAAATGGAVFENVPAERLQKTFAGIAAEFRQRYLVTYSPSGVKPGGWHALDVRVRGRRVTVKARPGYMGS